MDLAAELAAHEPFVGCDVAALAPLAARLRVVRHVAGDALHREGEVGTTFTVVLEGTVAIGHGPDGEGALHTAGPGSIVGELSMLTGRPRLATVTARTDGRVAVGDRAAFDELLGLPLVSERLASTVARRLAQAATVVPVTLRDGGTLLLRPLVPSDRAEVVDLIGRQSPAWRRSRFFGFGVPSARTIDHLVDIDYLDHFAWVAVDPGTGHHAAVGRSTRSPDDPAEAEVAFGVAEDHQGRGLATLLLGALGVTAATAGIACFTAQTLWENRAMRAVFAKAGARWRSLDPGVAGARFEVAAAAGLIDAALAADLLRTARDIATGAGLALVVPAR